MGIKGLKLNGYMSESQRCALMARLPDYFK
jgi:hypothetical protein